MARSKTPFGKLLGCGCFTLGSIVVVAAVAGIFVFVTSIMKNSDPFKHALAKVRNNPQAVAALGEPIEPGWFLTGSINTAGTSGSADISIPVSGSKASGKIYVVAEKSGGEWSYTTLTLTSDVLGQSLDLRSGQELEAQPIEILPEAPLSP